MRRLIVIGMGLLALLFAWRAVEGWIGGVAYVKGKYRVEHGSYKEAIPALDRGAVGGRKATALWLRGLAHFSYWQELVADRVPKEESNVELVAAFQDFTEAMTLSPASGWYPTELAQLYHMWDGMQRLEQGNLLSLIGQHKWAYVGHQGRVAVGLARRGVEREPNYFIFQDKLAIMLLNYELIDLGLDAVRESAKVQPLYAVHDYGNPQFIPPPIIQAFAEGSRESLGNTPMMPTGKHLIALGRVEFLRGNYAQAEEDLLAALEYGGDSLNRCDTYHHLGLAVAQLGRHDEALDYFEQAKEHEQILPWATRDEARVLLQSGRTEEGLQAYLRLRHLQPSNIGFALEYAAAAHRLERFDEAIEALGQVMTIAPDDTRGYRQLIGVHLSRGDLDAARETLDRMERKTGSRPDDLVRRLESEASRQHISQR